MSWKVLMMKFRCCKLSLYAILYEVSREVIYNVITIASSLGDSFQQTWIIVMATTIALGISVDIGIKKSLFIKEKKT